LITARAFLEVRAFLITTLTLLVATALIILAVSTLIAGALLLVAALAFPSAIRGRIIVSRPAGIGSIVAIARRRSSGRGRGSGRGRTSFIQSEFFYRQSIESGETAALGLIWFSLVFFQLD
jgi:hypothetical protein